MNQSKPRILLCWAYHRKHFINFFSPFDDQFEFIYLNWANKELDIGCYTECKKIYYLEYKNIQQLVEDIKPVKVVFMGIEGLGILLNQYCKLRGIPTYFLQHGVFHPYEAYLEEETLAKRKEVSTGTQLSFPSINRKQLSEFVKGSFSSELFTTYVTIAQLKFLTSLLGSKQKAYYYTQSITRRPTWSLVFTKFCSTVIVERDGVKDHEIIEIGNPETDGILDQIEHEMVAEVPGKYYLLIDDPLAETTETNGIFPVEVVKGYHYKLNQYAFKNGGKLVIKLHPDNYNSSWLLDDDNIIYMRNSNIPNLIKFSTGVFGGTSTLLIPALFSRPSCIFKLNDKYAIHQFIKQNNYCPLLDYQDFKVEDISFHSEISPENRQKFIKAYLFSTDKKSLNRLRDQLQSSPMS